MDAAHFFLLLVTVFYFYSACGCWLLQVMAYPTYLLVGKDEFVPFHVKSGQRLIPVFVIPAVLTCLASFVLVFVRPESVPVWAALIVAACSAVILGTTIAIEVPKHNKLDKDGKDDALIQQLIRDNLPRVICWTIGSAVLLYMTVQAFPTLAVL